MEPKAKAPSQKGKDIAHLSVEERARRERQRSLQAAAREKQKSKEGGGKKRTLIDAGSAKGSTSEKGETGKGKLTASQRKNKAKRAKLAVWLKIICLFIYLPIFIYVSI